MTADEYAKTLGYDRAEPVEKRGGVLIYAAVMDEWLDTLNAQNIGLPCYIIQRGGRFRRATIPETETILGLPHGE